jgi:hypothetical protein
MNENDSSQPASNNPSTSEQPAQFGSTAFSESKAAAAHAWDAVKSILADPIRGQGQAFEMLGGPKALRAGLVMLIAFAFSNYLFCSSIVSNIQKLLGAFMGLLGGLGGLSGELGSKFNMKLVLFCVVPASAIYLSYLLISLTMSARKKDHAACLFAAGITALPLSMWFLVIWLFGLSSSYLIIMVSLFCLSTTFIFISSNLRDIFLLNSRKNLLLTPAVIVLSTYASLFMYDVLM